MPLLSRYITLTDPSYIVKPRHLAFYEFGDSANPDTIVCLHGLSRNGLDFEKLATALASQHRVICPDMAGRGNSDWLTNKLDYNYHVYVADMLALLTQLRLTQVSWIGTSMGGIIGMMIAAGYPALIKKLVLNDVGSIVSAAGLKRIMGYVGTSSETFADRNAAITYLKKILAPFGITAEDEWEYMLNATFSMLPDGRYMLRYDPGISQPLGSAAGNTEAIVDIDLSTIWNTVKCPTLILRGALSDILSAQTASAMCNGRSNVKCVEIPGAGHAPALINHNQITIITDWLDNNPRY